MMSTSEKIERFITEDDLIYAVGGMQLIVIPTGYGLEENCYTAAFGSLSGNFATMMDDLASDVSKWDVIYGLFEDTPWYPYAQGRTITKTIEAAIDRINTIDPKFKSEALAMVYNSDKNYNKDLTQPMNPLVLPVDKI